MLDKPDGGNGLTVSEPQIDLYLLAIVNDRDINEQVLESSGQSAFGALDGDLSSLDGDGNYKITKSNQID